MSSLILASAQPNSMSIDYFLNDVGEFGKYQVVLLIMFSAIMIPHSLQILIMYFAAKHVDWKCVERSTKCTWNGTIDRANPLYNYRCRLPDNEWTYTEDINFSIVSQFQLSCTRGFFVPFSTSVFFIGWIVGAIALGCIADRYGRRQVLFPSLAFILLFGLGSVWAPNIQVFIFLRFLVGFFTPGVGCQLFIICSEIVGPKKRPLAGLIPWCFVGVASVLLGIKASFIKHWKKLFVVCTLPYIFVLLFARFIPESIRWLYVHGNTEEVMKILRQIAKANNTSLANAELEPLPKSDATNASVMSRASLFCKSRGMLLRSSLLFYIWLTIGVVYYGISLGADDLGGDMYRDYILATLIEIPAAIAAIFLCSRFGRKQGVVIPFLVAGIACGGVAITPRASGKLYFNAMRLVFGMIGKFAVTLAFNSVSTWSVELYPTSVRAAGMGLNQIAIGIGAASSPWIAKSLHHVHTSLSFSVMCGLTIGATALCLFLPETRDASTIETIEQMDQTWTRGTTRGRDGKYTLIVQASDL